MKEQKARLEIDRKLELAGYAVQDMRDFDPVRAGIVSNPEDYLYSSARNYAEIDALIEIDKIDIRWKTVK